ncbi:MAG: hypothetical protein K2I70_01050, partial [Bacilli bacterium]|nr:hypothetical protein [Bacilli bacterium]
LPFEYSYEEKKDEYIISCDVTVIKNNYYKTVYESTNDIIIASNYPPRGRILDAKGKILVDNKGVKTLIYHKLPDIKSEEESEIAKTLAAMIKIDNFKVSDKQLRSYYYLQNKESIDSMISSDILKRYQNREITADMLMDYKYSLITEEELNSVNQLECYIYHVMNKGYIYQDKVIKSNISDEELTKISDANIKGMRIDIKWERVYNYDSVLNSLFGSVGSIPKEDIDAYLENGYSRDDLVGVSFIEKYYEPYLKGIKGYYKVNKDYTLTKISEDIKGNDLVLNIDIEKQLAIEEALETEIKKAKEFSSSKYYQGSYIIVSDPNSGGIVALVAMKLNSNDEITSDVIGLLTNSYTVGSVVKGASQSVAYINGVLDEKTKMVDGCVKLYSQIEKCSWKRLGTLNDIDALTYSSNYFQFVNAIKVSGSKYKYNMKFNPTIDDFNKYRSVFKSYGLGVKTGIDLEEESLGITGTLVTGDLLLNLSIGQYDTYTPLMLNNYISTIANGGNRYKLRIVNNMIDTNGENKNINQVKILNKVPIEEKYMERIRTGLHNVVLRGTAAGYFGNIVKGAGKTGTSETYYNGVKTYTKSFVGYAPYD